MSGDRLDTWAAHPVVRTRHLRRAVSSADELWEVACSLRLRDVSTLGRLVRWRIPGTRPEQRLFELFTDYPFVVLEENPRALVSGLCGRIWTLARDYPRLDSPDAFRRWRAPGTVKVVLGHWASECEGGAELVFEARVEPVDARARTRLRALWAVVGRFDRLIGDEGLKVAAKRAEA